MRKYNLFIVILGILAASCDGFAGNPGGDAVKTGKVTFFNESSYRVIVHRDVFSGPVLLELNGGAPPKTIDVRVSDNYGVGTTFSIEYLYRIENAHDTDSGEIFASGIDPNVQINRVIEENKSITIQIPQPKNLEMRSAFIKILNSHNLPFILRYVGMELKQTGNGNLSVSTGKTGIYKLDNIPSEGKLYQNYEVVANFNSTTIPDFTANNGWTECFTYNGSSVERTHREPFIFK